MRNPRVSVFLAPLLFLVGGLHAGLIHRYSFNGAAGGEMIDSIGAADGVLHSGAKLDAKGALLLDGVNDWAELPADLLDRFQDVTLETWVEWGGPSTSSWQTLFALSKDNTSYLSFSPRAGTSPRNSRFALACKGPEKKVNGKEAFPTGTVVHVVTILDSAKQQLRLYIDGILQGTVLCSYSLESLGVRNVWLGKPLYVQFPFFKGRVLEFRIYDEAFTEVQVARSGRFGADDLPGPAISSFVASRNPVRSGSSVNLSWEALAGAKVEITPGGTGELAASGTIDVTIAGTTEFILKATNKDGERTARLTVEVDDRPIIQGFSANPRTVVSGEPVTLSWDVVHAKSVSINQGAPDISGAKGAAQVHPDSSRTYILTARNDSGSRTARVFVSVPGKLDIVINEVHYDSNPKTDKTEFIELYNNRTTEMDLSGWRFTDGVDFTFPEGTLVPAAGYFIIAEDTAAFKNKFGKKADGTYAGALSSNGEKLILRDAVGGRMDEVSYEVGFPWPTTPNGEGPSMQLLHPHLDNDLGGSWRPSAPTPGARNSIYTETPPPQVRQVGHKPKQPASNQSVTITAKITGVAEITEVSIVYQFVEPGDYIATDDARYATSWTSLPMRDNGKSGDVEAGDSIYSAVLPAEVSTHRRLVRYRITAKDAKGVTVTTPMADDPQPNFAFFCYDGVPPWQGSIRPGRASVVTYTKELLESLPVYHLITTRKAHVDSQYIPNSGTGKYGGSEYRWKGALVYDGEVYDHIRFRARGGVWRYAMGKNMWKFDFNRGHGFQARDDYGKKYNTRWDKLNFSAIIQQGNFRHRGENGMFESVGFRLFNLAGVEAPHTHFVHFRIIESSSETAANQYATDFQGPYLAIEQLDGDFLDAHGLPDGNLYKMERNTGPNRIGGESNNQGRDSVTDYSDLRDFKNTYENSTPAEAWWRTNVNLPSYYSYRSIVEGIHHGDIGYGKNYFYYQNPATKLWQTVPWDLDLIWANNMYGNGNEPFKSRVANSSNFGHEYQNRLREIRDLLYNPEQTGALIDEVATFIYKSGEPDFTDINQAMWDYNPILTSSYINSGKAGHGRFYEATGTRDFAGMLKLMKNYVVSRGNWIDNSLLTDNRIPRTPTATYAGPTGNPTDSLTFRTSAFADPQGAQTFGALRWRIAEVNHPGIKGYESRQRGKYEITATWEGELDTFANELTVPVTAVELGCRYRIRVRHKDSTNRWSHWSAPIEIVPGPPVRLPDLRKYLAITEIHYDPAVPTAQEIAAGFEAGDFEFIELRNLHSTKPLDLAGLHFTRGIDFTFPAESILAVGAFALVVANPAAFESRHGKGLPVLGAFNAGRLSNGGERLKLVFGGGFDVHDFSYDNKAPWPSRAGNGRSLILIDPEHGESLGHGANWASSAEVGGTPGTPSFTGTGSGKLLISEFMADNAATLADGAGDYVDWLEIWNPSAASIDLHKWYLTDDPDLPHKWNFPTGKTLAAGSHAIIFASGKGFAAPAGQMHTNFKISSRAGGYLGVYHEDGSIGWHYENYPAQREDVAYGIAPSEKIIHKSGDIVKYTLPVGEVAGSWKGGGAFDDASWQTAASPIGFGMAPGPERTAYVVPERLAGWQAYTGALGMDFDVTQTIEITEIGVFDDGSDGLKNTLHAEIWSRPEKRLITNLTFTPDDSGTLSGGSRFKKLTTPLELAPGAYSVVAHGYGAAERNHNAGQGGTRWSTDDGGGALVFTGAARHGAAGTFPTNLDGGPADRYAAGTFRYRSKETPFPGTDIAADMLGKHDSALLRIPFQIIDLAGVSALKLVFDYDDGFAAWVNGREVFRRNLPLNAAGRGSGEVLVDDLTGLLVAGENILAMEAWNLSAADPDFLAGASLVVVGTDYAQRYFSLPTPYEENNPSGIHGYVADTRFSMERGFFEKSFKVEIRTWTPGAQIRYTTDGSAPTLSHGTIYTDPLTISMTTVLRAAAFKDNYQPTNVDTQTYLFLDDVARQPAAPAGYPTNWKGIVADYAMDADLGNLREITNVSSASLGQTRAIVTESLKSLPTLSVAVDPADFFDPSKGIYLNPSARKLEVPASVELLSPDGSEKGFQENAGIRIMGGTSRNLSTSPKLSMRLLFKEVYGAGRLNYRFFPASPVDNYNSLPLRSNTRDAWPYFAGASYIADQWAKETQHDMGQVATAGRYVHLFINGLYWGVYNPTERPDAASAAERLGGDDSTFDGVKFCCPQRAVDGDTKKWDELLGMAKTGRLSGNMDYFRVQGLNPDGTPNGGFEKLLALDNLIDYVINGQYHAAQDWPGNYYVYRRRGVGSEGFHFITWDNDLALRNQNPNANKVRTDPSHNWWTQSPGILDIALRNNTEYRVRFADRAYQHLYHGALTPEASSVRWRRIAARIRPALIAESVRWGDLVGDLRTPNKNWEPVVQKMLTDYFPKRREILINQMRQYGLFPGINPPIFNKRGGVVVAGFQVVLSTAKGEIYYTLNGSDPRAIGGAVSDGARKYSAPLILQGTSVVLQVRTKSGSEWSPLDRATFIIASVKPSATNLAITEIHAAPGDPSALEQTAGFKTVDFEFVELRNLSKDKALALDGMQFTQGVRFTFRPDTVLNPGQYVLIVANHSAFEIRNGAGLPVAGMFTGKLDNGGETLKLVNEAGGTVHDFEFPESKNAGRSLVLVDPESQPSYNDPANWVTASAEGGSPGGEEPAAGLDTDSDGLPDAWEIQYFNDLAQAYHTDFDSDGLVNLLEYAFGSSPSDSNSNNFPQTSLGADGHFVLTYVRPTVASGLTYEIEFSPDLRIWRSTDTRVTTVSENGGPTMTVTVRDNEESSAESTLFYRIVVSTP